MRTVALGTTGLLVSELCIGTGTHVVEGNSRQVLLPNDGLMHLLRRAHELGVRFWDTSDDYGSHAHVGRALSDVERHSVVVTTKTFAHDAAGAEASLRRALAELRSDYVDVMLLHMVVSAADLEARRPALEHFVRAREQGRVRAVGISAHSLSALALAAEWPEIDVVLGRLNYAGHAMDGLEDRRALELSLRLKRSRWWRTAVRLTPGALLDLARKRVIAGAGPQPPEVRARAHAALAALRQRGKGVVVMKVMGAGPLASDPERAIHYVLDQGIAHSLLIGVQSEAELERNVTAIAAWHERRAAAAVR